MFSPETVIPINLILNIILVSLPEEFFLVAFCLIFMGRYDLIEFKKENVGIMSIPIVIVAITSNVLRYYIPSTNNYIFILMSVFITLLIVVSYRFFIPKDIFKAVIGTFLGLIIAAIIQTAYLPLLMYGNQTNLNEISNYGIPVFICALPERVIEAIILIFMFARKKSFLKSNLIKLITSSPKLAVITVSILFINIVFIAFVIWLIVYQKVLIGLSSITQLLSTVMVISIPIVNITALLFSIHQIKDDEARRRFTIQEELKVSIKDIRFFLSRKQYDRIEKEMVYLENDTKELFKEH